MANNDGIYLGKWASVTKNLDRMIEYSEEKTTDTKLHSETTENMHNYGRKPTIFSLSCVFLELLAGLVDVKRQIFTRVDNMGAGTTAALCS